MATEKLVTLLDARDRASAKFRGLARNARSMNSTLMRLGSGLAMYFSGRMIIGGMIAAVKASETFRRELAQINTMLDRGTEHYLPAFRDELSRLAVQFGDSTESLSKGLYDILSASVPAADALVYLRNSAKAAVAGVSDTATAVDGATSLMNAFRYEANRSAEVFDMMFTVIKRGKIEFPDLASNIGKLAPMARTADMAMGNMLATVAALTRQGFNAEQAMTGVTSILMKFPKAGRDIVGFLQKFRGLDLDAIKKIVPDKRAAAAISALSSDLDGLRGDIDAMGNSAGATNEAYAKMADSRRFQRLGQAWIAMKRNMGDLVTECSGFGNVIEWLIKKLPRIPAYWDLIATHVALTVEGFAADAEWAWKAMVESSKWAWDVMSAHIEFGTNETYLFYVRAWNTAHHFFTVQLPAVVKYFYENWGKIATQFGGQLKKNWDVMLHNLSVAWEVSQRELSFSLAEVGIRAMYSGAEQEMHLTHLRENLDQARETARKKPGYKEFSFDMGDVFEDLNIPERVKGEMEKALEEKFVKSAGDLLAMYNRLIDIPTRELSDTERQLLALIAKKKAALEALLGADNPGKGEEMGGADGAPGPTIGAGAAIMSATQARFLGGGGKDATPLWAQKLNAAAAVRNKIAGAAQKAQERLPREIAKSLFGNIRHATA